MTDPPKRARVAGWSWIAAGFAQIVNLGYVQASEGIAGFEGWLAFFVLAFFALYWVGAGRKTVRGRNQKLPITCLFSIVFGVGLIGLSLIGSDVESIMTDTGFDIVLILFYWGAKLTKEDGLGVVLLWLLALGFIAAGVYGFPGFPRSPDRG